MEKGLPPDYSKMSPMLAAAAEQQQPIVTQMVAKLGALQSITFQGVGAGGNDTYLAKFEKGALLSKISLDANGIVSTFLMQPYP